MANVYDMTDTWNNVSTTFVSIKMNATDTASASGSLLMDLQVGGVSQFRVSKAGAVTSVGAVSASGVTASGNVQTGTNGAFLFGGRTIIASSSDGLLRLVNNAQTDFGRLQLGGTTSSFPALKRSGTTVQARLADDSAFGSIQGKLTTDTAYTAGATTPTGYLILYDSNGTAYRVPALVNP